MQKSSIKYILKLSIPIFFANLAVPLVGIIDTSLMGNLEELSYLSATSIAANLFSMIFWSFGFLRMGTVGMVSNAFGQNNFQEITNILLRNLLFVLFLSLSLIILQNFILLLSLKIFSLSNDTSELFKQYFKIRIYSAPGELTIYIITGLFVGLQKTKISSLAVGFFSILNIILSIIFVTKYDLNIKGVAYGTLISAAVTSLIFLVYTFWYLNKISIINIDIKKLLNIKRVKEIFNINFNIFVRTILLTFSFLWFTYLGSQIGEKFVAANAILINLVFLSAFILDAYAFSTEGIVGYSLGKKDFKLFKSIIKNSFILSSITGLIISILYLIIHEKIIFLMTDIYTIRILSLDYSTWLIIIPFISSFCFQFDGIFIGASQTKELKNAMFFSVSLYLIISLILVNYFSNTGIWISLCIFMILRALSLFYYLDRIYLRFKK
ncbi:MAG: MATE family efflux transporter [Flavobacteriaceae bacterium]|nr:MATE family efflux transporter [Flavobacteriaceae bacterium]